MKSGSRVIPFGVWLLVLAPLLVAFFWGPLAFGGTTPGGVQVIDLLFTASFVLWLFLLLFEQRLPRFSLLCFGGVFLLVILGAAQYLNPRSRYDPEDITFLANESTIRWLPGSVDRASSLPILLHLGSLLLGGLVLQDAVSRSSALRWLVMRTIVAAALVIAVVGLYQKASGAEAMLWTTRENSGSAFFAAFRYHANAASFLNLSWPAALAVYLRSRWRRGGNLVTSLDLSVFFFVFAGVLVNSSKAGQVIGLVGAVFAAWRFRGELFRQNISRVTAVILGLVLLLALAVLVLPGVVLSHSKWSELVDTGGSIKGRLIVSEVCLRALPESGFFGTGAGTFRHVFPFYTSYLEEGIEGFWYHAHQDWLQCLLEWGFLGFAAWGVLFGGAIVRLGRRSRRAILEGREELTSSIALLSLALVLLHALVDFPLQIPAIQSLVVFYLAIAWSEPRKRRQSEGDRQAARGD